MSEAKGLSRDKRALLAEHIRQLRAFSTALTQESSVSGREAAQRQAARVSRVADLLADLGEPWPLWSSRP